MNKKKPAGAPKTVSTAADAENGDAISTPNPASPAIERKLIPTVFVKRPAAGPAANVKFIGRPVWDRSKRKIRVQNDPLTGFTDAGFVVELPAAELQIRDRFFYHPEAARIVRCFPNLYKKVVEK